MELEYGSETRERSMEDTCNGGATTPAAVPVVADGSICHKLLFLLF